MNQNEHCGWGKVKLTWWFCWSYQKAWWWQGWKWKWFDIERAQSIEIIRMKLNWPGVYLEIVREPGNTKDESEKEIHLGLVLKWAESTAKMRIKVKVIWPREGIEIMRMKVNWPGMDFESRAILKGWKWKGNLPWFGVEVGGEHGENEDKSESDLA